MCVHTGVRAGPHSCAASRALEGVTMRAEGWPCSGKTAPRMIPHAPSGPSATVAEWDFPRGALMPHCHLSISQFGDGYHC